MSKIEKLIAKFSKVPKDLPWNELVKIGNHKGYIEKMGSGKIGVARIKFTNAENGIINLHKPHPGNSVKQYVVRQILEKLEF